MRTWLVWGTGVLAYVIAVLHRTSFGVSGLEATERFQIAPTVLSTFVVLQLVVYALMQVPAGVLLDRFGARRMITSGALIMAAGQLTLAVAESLPLAILGRAVVGAGDALIFISVLRLIPHWFDFKQVPLLTQMSGIIGQLGQILSAVPFLALLHGPGWGVAYTSVAALGVLTAVLTLAVVRDHPPGVQHQRERFTLRQTGARVVAVWRRPGTRLGFFSHLGTQFPFNTFTLMWGVPYLLSAQQVSTGSVGVLLSIAVLSGIVTAPIVGVLTSRHPMRRSWLVLGVIAANAGIWTAVLARSEPAPMWLLVLLVVILAVGGPGSMIGFDFARSFNTSGSLGTAQGLVNGGGFSATVVLVFAVGAILDAAGGYSFEAFRLAFSAQYVLWILAVIGILINRRKVRRALRDQQP